jgi:hypothetical protein
MGQRGYRHGCGDARARHRAEKEAGGDHGPARRRGRGVLAEQGKRPFDKEPPCPAPVEYRAIDGEEDDEGRRDIQRRGEYTLEGQEVLPDDAVHREAAVLEHFRDQPAGADIAIDEENERDGRQDPANRAARRLEHQQDQREAEDQFLGGRPHGARLVLLDVQRQVDRRVERDGGEDPVSRLQARQEAVRDQQWIAQEAQCHQHAEPIGEGGAAVDGKGGIGMVQQERDRRRCEQAADELLDRRRPCLRGAISPRFGERIEDEDQREAGGEERRAVDRRIDRELRPVEREGANREAGSTRRPAEPALDPSGRTTLGV